MMGCQNMRQMKCPNCGAVIDTEVTGRDYIYCEYCGTKMDLTSFRVHITIEDKAKIKEIEAREAIRNKELEKASKNHFLRNWMLVLLAFAICIVIGYSGDYSSLRLALLLIGILGLFISIPGGFILYLIELFKNRRRKM